MKSSTLQLGAIQSVGKSYGSVEGVVFIRGQVTLAPRLQKASVPLAHLYEDLLHTAIFPDCSVLFTSQTTKDRTAFPLVKDTAGLLAEMGK